MGYIYFVFMSYFCFVLFSQITFYSILFSHVTSILFCFHGLLPFFVFMGYFHFVLFLQVTLTVLCFVFRRLLLLWRHRTDLACCGEAGIRAGWCQRRPHLFYGSALWRRERVGPGKGGGQIRTGGIHGNQIHLHGWDLAFFLFLLLLSG